MASAASARTFDCRPGVLAKCADSPQCLSAIGRGGALQLLPGTPKADGRGTQCLRSAQPNSPPCAATRSPKIGSVSWNFHSLAPGAHPEEAIDIIGSLGFEGIELIANSREDVDRYWTDRTIDLINAQLERNHLVLSQFPFFQRVVEGLASRNTEERKHSVEYFERGCRIAKKLGAPMVNIVAPWARELSAPSTRYLPRYFMSDPKPGEKFHIDIAPGYDFEGLWDAYSQPIKLCLESAKAQGLKFSIENHTHTMVPATDSFLACGTAFVILRLAAIWIVVGP